MDRNEAEDPEPGNARSAKAGVSSTSPIEVPAPRRPGRPRRFEFGPDETLSESERKLKTAVAKRRLRQNRSYHRRKHIQYPRVEQQTPHVTVFPPAVTSLSRTGMSSMCEETTRARTGTGVTPGAVADVPQAEEHPFPPGALNPEAWSARQEYDILADLYMSTGEHSPRTAVETFNDFCMYEGPFLQGLPLPQPPAPPPATSPEAPHASGLPVIIAATRSTSAEMRDGSNAEQIDAETLSVSADDVTGIHPVITQRATLNMTDVADLQTSLQHIVSVRDVVFDNLRTRIGTVSSNASAGLQCLSVFRSCFDAKAARAVIGLPINSNAACWVLNELLKAQLIEPSPACARRYRVNNVVREYFAQEISNARNANAADRRAAQMRFREYFSGRMDEWQTDDVYKLGWSRQQAIMFYDAERQNLDHLQDMCRESSDADWRCFLARASPIMRFTVPAHIRQGLFLAALRSCPNFVYRDQTPAGSSKRSSHESEDQDDDASSEQGEASGPGSMLYLAYKVASRRTETNFISELLTRMMTTKPKPSEENTQSRLEIALAEAQIDGHQVQESEGPLVRALESLRYRHVSNPPGLIESSLAMTLLAQVRLLSGKKNEARELCVAVLKLLHPNNLRKSTIALKAMTILVHLYIVDGRISKAETIASRLIDLVQDLLFTDTPIYSATVGVHAVCGQRLGQYWLAERQFTNAIDNLKQWESRPWRVPPIEDCQDLEIWLQEGLAQAIYEQGRQAEAEATMSRVAFQRVKRRLSAPVSSDMLDGEGREARRHLPLKQLSFRQLY